MFGRVFESMTETLDLGSIGGPLLVFGGPYGNLQATRALLDEAERSGIPRLLCTGDVVAYCADPQGTVDLLRRAGVNVVMGNCEEALGSASEDCGCGFDKGSACDNLAAEWYRYSLAALDRASRAWMQGLPRRISFRMAGRRLLAVHGGVRRINRFVFPATPGDVKQDELRLGGADGIIAGHSGLPFTQFLGRRLWHNAGAIGLPANDGTQRVWYSLLRPLNGTIAIEHRPLRYDHDTAARRMRAAGLPPPYAAVLATGLWPADDIMPEADRRARGQPLSARRFVW